MIYSNWEVAQGLMERDAYDEARHRRQVRADALESLLNPELNPMRGRPSYAGEAPTLVKAGESEWRIVNANGEVSAETGWVPAPRHMSRAHAQELSGAEFLHAPDGELVAYRPKQVAP